MCRGRVTWFPAILERGVVVLRYGQDKESEQVCVVIGRWLWYSLRTDI